MNKLDRNFHFSASRTSARRFAALTVFLGFVASDLSAASGSALTYQYGGTITSADPSTGMAPGAAFSGTFTYDPADKSQDLTFEGYHSYLFGTDQSTPSPGLPLDSGLTLAVGGQAVGSLQGGLGLSIYESQAAFPVAPAGMIQNETELTIRTGSSGNNPITVLLELTNPGQTVYPTSLDMPTAINLADFPSATLSVRDASGNLLYTGTIDSLQPVPAPEPTTALVVAGGLLAWFAGSKRGPWRYRR